MKRLSYFIILICTTINYCNPGNLDTSFNQSGAGPSNPGSVILNLSDQTTGNSIYSRAQSVVVDSDSKVIIAGYGTYASAQQLAVARFLNNGTLDPLFNANGTPGYATFQISGATESVAQTVFLDNASDNIVIAGYTYQSNMYKAFIARFIGGNGATAGTLDTSFAHGVGYATYQIPTNAYGTRSLGMYVQENSNIIITGDVNGNFIFIARILGTGGSAGTLDTSFGNGTGYTTLFSDATPSSSLAVGLQPITNKYIIAGYTTVSGIKQMFTARFSSTGILDNSLFNPSNPYGSNGLGYTTTTITEGATSKGLAIKGNGTTLITGSMETSSLIPGPFVLAQFTSNGQPDTNFGNNGIVLTQIIDDENYNGVLKSDCTAAAFDLNGKIIASGSVYYNSGAIFPFLARYNQNGSLDTTFSPFGYIILRINGGMVNCDVSIQLDGKAVFAGSGFANNIQQITIGRCIGGVLESQATPAITNYGYNPAYISEFLYQSFYATVISDPSVQTYTLEQINNVIATYTADYSQQPNFNYIAYLYLLATQLLTARTEVINLYPFSVDEINRCFDYIDERILQLIQSN